MKIADASREIWDYPDEYNGSFDAEQLMKVLEKFFRENQFKCIVMHNLHGEYGHSQHKSISKILHDQRYNNLYVFDKSDEILSFNSLKKKLNLLSVYHSQIKGNIEQLMQYVIYGRIVLSTKNRG